MWTTEPYSPLTACVCAPWKIHSPTGEETSSPFADHPCYRVCLQTASANATSRAVRVKQRKNTSSAAAINRGQVLEEDISLFAAMHCTRWQRLRCQSIHIMHLLSALDLHEILGECCGAAAAAGRGTAAAAAAGCSLCHDTSLQCALCNCN